MVKIGSKFLRITKYNILESEVTGISPSKKYLRIANRGNPVGDWYTLKELRTWNVEWLGKEE